MKQLQNRRKSAPMIVLFLILLLPSFLFSADFSSSMAIGTIAAAFFSVVAVVIYNCAMTRFINMLMIFFLVFVFIAIHLSVLTLNNVVIDFGRAFGSLFLLAILFIGAGALADLMINVEKQRIVNMIHTILWVLLFIGFVGGLGVLQPFADNFTRPVFPFSEPSHFALVLTPFLIAGCVSASPPVRIILIVIVLIITALLQSLTLAAVSVLSAIICLRIRYIFVLISIAILPISLININYYTERLDFTGNIHNLSNLVYIQGWQFIFVSWDVTSGLGRGFQQLGLFDNRVFASDIIKSLVGKDLNLLDGGFTLSKIVSEFGFIGILMIGNYMTIAIRAVRTLRAAAFNLDENDPLKHLSASIIVGYSVELALRGAGYFTPTGLLFLTALSIWFRHSTLRLAKPRWNAATYSRA